jgi:hypothetical protein
MFTYINIYLLIRRESLAFYDGKITNGGRPKKEMIFRVTVHETVHQWFGNLVTPKWLVLLRTHFKHFNNFNSEN